MKKVFLTLILSLVAGPFASADSGFSFDSGVFSIEKPIANGSIVQSVLVINNVRIPIQGETVKLVPTKAGVEYPTGSPFVSEEERKAPVLLFQSGARVLISLHGQNNDPVWFFDQNNQVKVNQIQAIHSYKATNPTSFKPRIYMLVLKNGSQIEIEYQIAF
jgi:hypothetical protein